VDAELSALVGPEDGSAAPCQGKADGDLCFVRKIAGVCKSWDNKQECMEGRAEEVALAYDRSTGSGWSWNAATVAGFLALATCLALLSIRSHTRLRLVRLQTPTASALLILATLGSLGAIATLAAARKPALHPSSYAAYAVPPEDVPTDGCKIEPGTPHIAGFEWGLRFPTEASSFGRPALFVVLRNPSALAARSLLLVVDAEDLVPLWHMGPCPMNVEPLPHRAIASQPSGHIVALDGEARALHAWWIRSNGSSRIDREDDLRVSTLARWGDTGGVLQVTLNVVDGSSTEVVLQGFPRPNATAAWPDLESARGPADGSGSIRFLAHGYVYELRLDPFQLIRIATDDVNPVAVFPRADVSVEGKQ
jgi:hypothetical protein